jgi:hypothetical protein
MSQFELFAQPAVVEPTVPTVESIRARFEALLGPMRSAESMPLTDRELAYWKVVAPQMANWLPEGERDAVRDEFAAQVARLSGAGAAQ